MQLTSHGHSCLLLSDGVSRVLIDPGAFSPDWEHLFGLDAVLITHAHPDHVDLARLPTLLKANPAARVLAEPQLAASAAMAELDVVVEPLTVGSEVALGGIGSLSIQPVGGEHATIYSQLPVIGNVGLVITAVGRRFFHPGDSLAVVPEDIDVLAVPLMAPWMAGKEMVDFVRAVAPSVAVPIHDGLVVPAGRAIYLNLLTNFGGSGLEVFDFGGRTFTL